MRTLAVRLDSLGDVLVTGPALRAYAAASSHLTLWCGERGRAAAELLPGVDDVLCWTAPWVDPEPGPLRRPDVEALVDRIAVGRFDRAVVFTSFHQSPLPAALLLRMAGVPHVAATSVDHPGSLLDVRHRLADDDGPGDDRPETERALALAWADGVRLPPRDDGRLALRRDAVRVPPRIASRLPTEPFVVLHPGTSVPARAWPPARFASARAALQDAGLAVVVTGAPHERDLTAEVAGPALDLGGATDLAGLAGVLARAAAVVVANTGPAHLAAAVGTPVVSLFAPTVPATRWAPHGVPRVLLGDQHAPCRASRATRCPVPGHPCLSSVTADDVVAAVAELTGLLPPPGPTGALHAVPAGGYPDSWKEHP